jgi:hypothetical protein
MLEMQFHVVRVQAVLSVLMLIGFLIASTLFQQRATKQVRYLLEKVSRKVSETEFFQSAERYFERREYEHVFLAGPHAVPVWLLIIVVTGCSIGTFFGAQYYTAKDLSPLASFVLGGAYAADPTVSPAELNRYQAGTAFVGSMAFLGAYVWTIAQVVNRIDNNDMNPATYYFLSVRILTACLVAGMARHIFEAIPGLRSIAYSNSGAPVGLAALGFLIGWNPTLWINELLLKIGDLIKSQIPSQRWPQNENMPLNLTLMMLQGMVPDKIERMNELNIDNCQKLATENPVILWVRTSYTLELIIDWIAQAQLAVRFEADTLQKLRSVGIRDIFTYGAAISQTDSLTATSEKVGIPTSILVSHAGSILICPACARLAQIRAALLPEVAVLRAGPVLVAPIEADACCG